MNLVKKCRDSLHCAYKKIHLVDKCLIVFMFILLAQSAYTLFCPNKATNETNQFDIIVRTSSASIFGYFISANFIRNNQTGSKKPPAPPEAPASGASVTMGFAPPQAGGLNLSRSTPPRLSSGIGGGSETARTGAGGLNSAESPTGEASSGGSANRLQVIIATAIGVFSLLVLIIFRDQGNLGVHSLGAVAQFRDFVSACVGFLIGCATGKSED